jgi:type VI protein secretion system component Hcp
MFGAIAFAQDAQLRARFQTKSTIAVTIDGLTCNNSQGTIPALSWSFGVSRPTVASTGGGGSSTRKASLYDLNVARRADSCTPFLFATAVTGKSYKSVTIVQQDTQKDDIFTVTLQDVVISSYQLGGDQSGEVPVEQIGFNFDRICVADSVTETKACWDLRTARFLSKSPGLSADNGAGAINEKPPYPGRLSSVGWSLILWECGATVAPCYFTVRLEK